MKKKILIILGIFLLVSGYLYIESRFLKPNYIGVRKETINDESIPDSFNNFEIVYFSDLTYDDLTDLDKIATKINNLNPDIVLFGGDAVSESLYLYNQQTIDEITDFFKSIKANYAKYAVFGEKDNSSEFVKDTISEIYLNSGFELLNNRAIKFRINTTDYINIVGLEDYVSGQLSLSSAFSNIKPDTYTLVVTHSPDIFNELTGTKTNLCLAGHSLGGKVNIPIYGPFERVEGAIRYYNGKYKLQEMALDVSDGVNTGKDNYRFLTNNEIVSYKIKKNIVETEKEPIKDSDDIKETDNLNDITDSIEELVPEVNKEDLVDTHIEKPVEETPSRPAIENVFGN